MNRYSYDCRAQKLVDFQTITNLPPFMRQPRAFVYLKFPPILGKDKKTTPKLLTTAFIMITRLPSAMILPGDIVGKSGSYGGREEKQLTGWVSLVVCFSHVKLMASGDLKVVREAAVLDPD